MNFHDHLAGWSGPELGRLLAARPDLLSAAVNGLSAVARKATTALSLGRVLVGADVGMLVVAEALVARNPATVAEIDALLGTSDPTAVAEAVQRLQAAGVVVVVDGVVSPVGALPDLLHRPLGLGPSMVELAGHLEDRLIDDLAHATQADGSGRRSATIRAVAHRLSQTDVVERLLAEAPTEVIELFETLVDHRSPAIGLPTGYPYRSLDDDDPLGWLMARGLVVAVTDTTAELPRELVIATRPQGLAPGARLRPVEPTTVDGLSADLVAGRAADAVNRLLDGAESLLRLADRGEISVRKLGGIGPRELGRLARATGLTVDEATRILELLASARLVVSDGSNLTSSDLAPRWWSLARRRRYLVLVRAWIGAERFLSRGLDPADAEPVATGAAASTGRTSAVALGDSEPLAAVADARRITLEAISTVAEGQAITPQSLAESVVWQAPNLWGTGDPLPEALVAWMVAEAELLGLVADGAPSDIGRAVAAGDEAALEQAAAAVVADDQETFVLQADLTAVSFGPLAPAIARSLSEMTERAETDSGRRFSETSLRRAFDRGWTEESITGFLEQHALSGVPQPLGYLLGEVARRYGTVKVMAASSVLVTADEALAVEIATNRRASTLGLRLVAPTVLTAAVDPIAAIEILRDLGHFPTLDGSTLTVDRPGSADASSDSPSDSSTGAASGTGSEGGERLGDVGADLPADWTGPPVPDLPLPDEIDEAVTSLTATVEPSNLTPDADSAGGPSLDRFWRRSVVIDVIGADGVDRLAGVVVGLGETVALLTPGGVVEVPATAVMAADDGS